MKRDEHWSECTYSMETKETVQCLAFSPYAWSSSLLAVGMRSHLALISCHFPEEDISQEDFEYEVIREVHHGCGVLRVEWSPQTSLALLPRVVKFATIGEDKQLRIFSSNLKNEDTVESLQGHSDYVNDLAYEPLSGDQLASVSDDHTCCLWSLSDGTLKARLPLTSPGTGVGWHRDSPNQLLVAEKKGVVRMYNVTTQQPLMSLDCNAAPLTCADWCPLNSLIVGATASSYWFVWNTSISSRPTERKLVHPEGATALAFSRTGRNLLATRGRPSERLCVTNLKLNQVVLTATLLEGGGLSWHGRLPLLAVGSNRTVCLWKVESS